MSFLSRKKTAFNKARKKSLCSNDLICVVVLRSFPFHISLFFYKFIPPPAVAATPSGVGKRSSLALPSPLPCSPPAPLSLWNLHI